MIWAWAASPGQSGHNSFSAAKIDQIQWIRKFFDTHRLYPSHLPGS